MAGQWIKCKSTGVRYRQHETRKHGVAFDRYFTIRYKVAGKEKSEGLGWASEGWTEKKAAAVLAELKANHTTGQGPATLSEKREIKRQEDQAAELERQASIRQNQIQEATRFDRVFDNYCDANSQKKSLKDEINYFKNWIAPQIGKKRLQEIILLDLERIRKAMEKASKAPRSIQYVKSIIRQVFHHAMAHNLFTGDPPTKNFLKKQRNDNRRQRYLTPEEADMLLEKVKGYSEKTYQIALLSLNTGLRFGEIASLQWQHINKARKEIIVLDPKNSESRSVFMTDVVVGLFSGITPGNPAELIFPSSTGGIRPRVSKVFARAVNDLGLNDGVTDRRMQVVFHSLRHSCASWLVNAGVELPTIAKILGHKTLAMTMRYSHVNDNSVKNAMATLDQQQKYKPEKIVSINSKR